MLTHTGTEISGLGLFTAFQKLGQTCVPSNTDTNCRTMKCIKKIVMKLGETDDSRVCVCVCGGGGGGDFAVAVNNAHQPTPSRKEALHAYHARNFAWVSQKDIQHTKKYYRFRFHDSRGSSVLIPNRTYSILLQFFFQPWNQGWQTEVEPSQSKLDTT